MPKPQLHSLCALALLLLASVLSLSDLNSSELDAVCAGKIGQCALQEDLMDSESNRRALLMRRRYISYDTLRRDLVPCDRPGASYYNCKGTGVANSYGRGCEMITRCARGE
ncbi:protein RALF-like 24 [Salvia miltiorrhiza]|uniref:protein RALF-like 24 n=1 Tax=Salvia miltiorrhiza TaxID=226208 RepID=UPI0025AC1F8E|nr:protein RALF-like 24 [Salvia miltiorrhiza]